MEDPNDLYGGEEGGSSGSGATQGVGVYFIRTPLGTLLSEGPSLGLPVCKPFQERIEGSSFPGPKFYQGHQTVGDDRADEAFTDFSSNIEVFYFRV